MPRRIESLLLQGPAGKLEALLEEPDEQPTSAALVCHPHPQHGGTLHNKVVYRAARALRRTGSVVLRFNYRGVNLSEGVYDHGFGETDDARTALDELRQRYPGLPLIAAGFSFGSRIALRLGTDEAGITRVLAIGFPAHYPNHEYVAAVQVPKFFIHSTHDDLCSVTEVAEFVARLPEPKEFILVEAADHFFRNNLDGLEAAIEEIQRGASLL